MVSHGLSHVLLGVIARAPEGRRHRTPWKLLAHPGKKWEGRLPGRRGGAGEGRAGARKTAATTLSAFYAQRAPSETDRHATFMLFNLL